MFATTLNQVDTDGGPWVKDIQTIQKWNLDKSMEWIKKSFEASVMASYDLIHVDPTVDIFNRNIAIETVVDRILELMAHTEEAAIALMDLFNFDSILFPFNWVCWFKDNFGPKVLSKAQKQHLGIPALKALAKRTWNENEEKKWPKCWYAPVESFEEASLALRFILSKPITAAV